MIGRQTRRRGRWAGRASVVAGLVLAWAAATATATPAVSAQAAITLGAATAEIRSGKTTELRGTLVAGGGVPVAGAAVELQVDPYPYRGFFDASHTTTAGDGSFAFGPVRPDRNTRYRVRAGRAESRPVVVYVDASAVLRSYDRGPGRTMLTMVSYHSGYFRWVGVRVYWYVAPAGRGSFHLAAVTRTRELRPGVTYATATIDPPAADFVYRVCFNGAREAGTGPPSAHARCPPGDFGLPRP